MEVRYTDTRRGGNYRGFAQKRTDKKQLFCDSCRKPGHMRENYFKLIGYPDWYKDLQDQKKKGGKAYTVNVIEEIKDDGGYISELVKTEILKMMRKNVELEPVHVNYARLDEFAGTSLNSLKLSNLDSQSWIVDTGATSHMCVDIKLMHSLAKLAHSVCIHLPDGTTREVTHSGSVHLSNSVTLTAVLYVPKFHHNLLSVSQLCKSMSVSLQFFDDLCMVQDLRSKRVLAIGKQIGKLYVLDKNSFNPAPSCSI
ncbi:UNVERIFIED_CONTAM: hypothetical protein Sradi_3861800 [Sesamum radiatum]|uniref:Retrovirus-related Pol polyprotein from transposon TNT 1-94-like beta-barrel domain-containing protein n=1 Tax=Sesamum radiatum TaxID=300843 RepID=A0AAW2Q218_SESRA